MVRARKKYPPRLALFDRLLEGDSIDNSQNTAVVTKVLHTSIRRDLENLFNTRPLSFNDEPEHQELNQSVIAYGMPTLLGQNLSTEIQREGFRSYFEMLIKRFEPRFKDISVELIQRNDDQSNTLYLKIQAILETEMIVEEVVLDTVSTRLIWVENSR